MKLSKGHQATLDLMKVNAVNYSDEELKIFFAFTDRGEGDVNSICAERPNLAELFVLFKNLSLDYNMWKEDLKSGLLMPQDFYNESEATFKRVKRADLEVWGLERKIWGIMEWGRTNHMSLEIAYEEVHQIER